jgi:hypothetical protein
LWLRKQTRTEYPQPPTTENSNSGIGKTSADGKTPRGITPSVRERQYSVASTSVVRDQKRDINGDAGHVTDEAVETTAGHIASEKGETFDPPLEPHVSTAILVTDDDEDDERNNNNSGQGTPGTDLKKQNKTEEVPLKTNNIFSSLVDRSTY